MDIQHSPHRYFMTMSCKAQRIYYLEQFTLLTPLLRSFVSDVNKFATFSKHNRIRTYKKLDALIYCSGELVKEAKSYNRFRTKRKNKHGKYSQVDKAKPSTIENRANLHLNATIEALYELSGNMHNIKTLKSIIIRTPLKKEVYYNHLTDNAQDILLKAGFENKRVEKILPILKSLNKN